MPPPTGRNQRIAPTELEVRRARTLLESVPTLGYDWTSAEGQAFLAYLDTLTASGVPVAWIADSLGLDAPRLYATLTRHRKAARSTTRKEA